MPGIESLRAVAARIDAVRRAAEERRRRALAELERRYPGLKRKGRRPGGASEPEPVRPPSPDTLSGGAAAPLEFDD